MTAQEHIERIRAAHKAYKLLDTDVGRALSFERSYNIRYELSSACNPTAMSSVLAHIDQQQAEIERLQTCVNDWLYANGPDGWIDRLRKEADRAQPERPAPEPCKHDFPESCWPVCIKCGTNLTSLRLPYAPQAQPERPAPAKPIEDCLCGKCRLGKISDMGLIRCEKCGAHACPHAMDHEVPCPVYDTAAPSQPERKPISEDKA